MPTTISRTYARALTSLVALALSASLFGAPAPAAHAATSTTASTASAAPAATAPATKPASKPKKPKPTKAQKARAFAKRVIAKVASRKGRPYAYGAAGPGRFDCSGLTMWTFKKLGRKLPHSSAAQYGRTKHLRAKDRRPGDLVFFHDGGGIYHVGIYAGKNQIWHAPRSGSSVRKERIWTGSVYYGRVR